MNTQDLHSDMLQQTQVSDAGTRASITRLVHAAMPSELRRHAVATDDTLGQLGMSSLRLVGLIVELEEEFGLTEDALLRLTGDTTIEALAGICAAARSSIDSNAGIRSACKHGETT